MLTLITCTGHRIEAFKLCIEYVKAQTFTQNLQWIIINDDTKSGELKPLLKNLPKNIIPELYQGPEIWKPGVNTHKKNMEQAILNIKGERILFIEDDDYYAPQYVEAMNTLLDYADIVGEANACYYNLRLPGWRRMQNYNQASLCQTGIKASLLPILKSTLRMDGNIDGNLWELAHKGGVKGLLMTERQLCIGMKGLPGRPGIGIGHQFKDFLPDPNLGILRKWLGEAAKKYIDIIKETKSGQVKKDSIPPIQKSEVKDRAKVSSVQKPNLGKPVQKAEPKGQIKKSETLQSNVRPY